MHPAFERTDHRPWPLPRRPWVMTMHWHDLLFLHWPVAPERLRPHIPPQLELDLYDGQAWIGVVPFWMSRVRPRLVPDVLGFAFPELNVRTYVTVFDQEAGGARPGVWFFSLDATSRLAVRAARWGYHLPYFDAEMQVLQKGRRFRYASRRVHRGADPATLELDYQPTGEAFHAAAGTLDHWLTERYRLYTDLPGGRIGYVEIQHPPWPLQPADAAIRENTMTRGLGLQRPDREPVLHFAKVQPVVGWSMQTL